MKKRNNAIPAMNRIAEVAQLKKLMDASREHTGCQAGEILCETLSALPWLLAVAGQFQGGDADRMLFAVAYLKQTNCPAQCIDAVSRMLTAAKCMEAEL